MYSRVRASGLGKRWPYHPSTTCGPDTPRPRMCLPPRQVVERQRGHRARGRCPGRQLNDRRAESHPLGLPAPPRQRCVGVRAPGFRGEHGVEAGLLGRGHQFGVVLRRLRAPNSPAEVRASLDRLSTRG